MKRHASLQPLSRQHHNGLLLALLVEKGLRKKAHIRVISDFIRQAWEEDLKEHFLAEEEILLPALTQSNFNPVLTARLLNEHSAIREIIAAIINKEADYETFSKFHFLLSNHIRFEERIFFPEAEKLLSPETLEMIGTKLKEGQQSNCMNYPVRFWE